MRILIAEDHELVSSTLCELVKRAFSNPVIANVKTSAELADRIRHTAWDVVLLDVELSDTLSLPLIPEIKRRLPKCRILVISGHSEHVFGLQAIKAGADGFMHKCAPTSEFLQAIKNVSEGRKHVSTELAGELVELCQAATGMEKPAKLSAREVQVMHAIAAGKYNSEIAGELGLSEKTISTYRTRILTKLALRNNAELVKYAMRMGYAK